MPIPPNTTDTSPRWMGRWLFAAGVYNLLWGGAMVLAPVKTMHLLGVRPATLELWPQLWACVGMIVGVYGIGYLIAARDPARHWPIVLVGLLGKIFGPIGFIDSAVRGLLPWSMGATILTNDLLWWIPFTLILWHAAKVAQGGPPGGAVSLETALQALRDVDGKTLHAMTNERATLVLLLRHSGCTFCKQAMSDLSRWQKKIHDAGVGLAVVGMSPASEDLRAMGRRYSVESAAFFADPDRLLYRALELPRGSFLQLFGPRVWWGGFRAAIEGHGVGRLEGDGFQMPGAFVIHNGQVLREYRHATAADRPDLETLACPLN